MRKSLVIRKITASISLGMFVILLTFYLYSSASLAFQNDSEALAISLMAAEKQGLDIETEGYGLGWLRTAKNPGDDIYAIMRNLNDELAEGYTYSPYKSQVGIQGWIYAIVNKILPPLPKGLASYEYFRLACCFFMVIIVGLIIHQLYKKYGCLFSIVFGVVTFMSPWVVDFSRNMYWVEFTWFIPMLLGLFCLNYEGKKKFIFPLFTIAIFVKCLCGYEYLSTIMMSGIMFIIVEWFVDKEKRKELFKTIFIIGICSILGFASAYIVHSYMYGTGNIVKGLQLMQVNLIERRTWGNPDDFADPKLSASLKASVWDVLIRYFWRSGRPLTGKVMLLLLIVTVVALIYQNQVLKKRNIFEASSFLVTLLTTISWFVLAKAHSYVHAHMNFVLFYMGWVQVSIYIICEVVLETRRISLDYEE